MNQQNSKADAVEIALAPASPHTRSVSGAHTSSSISNSTSTVKVEVEHLKRQVTCLTHLVRLLADRTALEISEGQDDSLAWIQAELRRLEA